MKLLCIGKSGQVARALAERAAAQDMACATVGRPDVDLLRADSLVSAIQIHKPDVVINAGAYTAVDAAETDQERAFLVNADGAGALAAACAAMGVPLIHLSTDYVFDGHADRPYRETDLPAPINVYGASKLAGEVAIREVTKQHIILRCSWVISPFGQNFVKTMLRLAKERGGASVVDDQIGSLTTAGDIAETVFQVATKLVQPENQDLFGTYHYCSRGHASWADVAELIFQVYQNRTNRKIELKRIPSSEYPTPARRPLNSRLETEKIERAFNVTPQDWTTSVTQIVTRLIDEGY
ncbi:MAG: dTDP-4-dehydrorhamnose reductase [Pseudomonadota bacterium]